MAAPKAIEMNTGTAKPYYYGISSGFNYEYKDGTSKPDYLERTGGNKLMTDHTALEFDDGDDKTLFGLPIVESDKLPESKQGDVTLGSPDEYIVPVPVLLDSEMSVQEAAKIAISALSLKANLLPMDEREAKVIQAAKVMERLAKAAQVWVMP